MFAFIQNLTSTTLSRAVHHSKQCPPPPPPKLSNHKDGGYKIYKYMTFVLCLPAILAVAAYTYIQKLNRECEERPPFVPYEFMRRRTKRFPWGDGNKSLFHNPAVNALPEGYEEGGEECEGQEASSGEQ